MNFQNFNNFRFMYDNLAQDITVTTITEDIDDDLGTTKPKASKTVHLHEPILNTLVPNDSYGNADGGQISTTTYKWESKHGDFDKGDQVETSLYGQFKVTDKATDVAGGLYEYTLQRIGDDDFVS